tara:strand:- start:570 stop:713 length:144 start_codon:yes stop_codon:yes gene_type:complete
MPYSKRKAIMIEQMAKIMDIRLVAVLLEINIESVKRAIRYARKICLK